MKIASQYNISIRITIEDLQGERSERSERSIDSLVKNIPIVEEKQADNIVKILSLGNENGSNCSKNDLKEAFVKTVKIVMMTLLT